MNIRAHGSEHTRPSNETMHMEDTKSFYKLYLREIDRCMNICVHASHVLYRAFGSCMNQLSQLYLSRVKLM